MIVKEMSGSGIVDDYVIESLQGVTYKRIGRALEQSEYMARCLEVLGRSMMSTLLRTTEGL